jgi:4-hydroxyphenylpyruvate dioxygenase
MEYQKPTERPEIGKFFGFDHVVFWVGNAKQAASFYTSRFGFEFVAYQGLETGDRAKATHVVKKGKIIFAFSSSYGPYDNQNKDDLMGQHLIKHGDGVRDMALTVEDAKHTHDVAVKRGAKSVLAPKTISDEFGSVVIASIQTYGDTIHTFVQRTVDGKEYKGVFLPGYKEHFLKDPLNEVLGDTKLGIIDHIVGNQYEKDMEPTANWYQEMLDFHRFWSIDDKMIHTTYSSLNSIVMADFDENIKLPINEPAKGQRKSQIQEYVDYYAGAGVQHIALKTENIIDAVSALRKRGVEFLPIPKSYYDNFRKALPNLTIDVKEDIDTIERLGLLIDYDNNGYLLQLFTKPLEDRPTLFIEIIQRRNFEGFGAGNFKSLFQAIEDEQERRGNLTETK